MGPLRVRSSSRRIALAALVAIGAVACTGGSGPGPITPTGSGPSAARHGGNDSLIIGAEQSPACLNPITACASLAWYGYMIRSLVLPRLVQWSNAMQPEPSPLILRVPSLDNGDISESPFPFAVTYHLNPNATWSDGTPITCADVAFTRDAILHTTGSSSTVGYDVQNGAAGIRFVDCPDPLTVRLVFSKPYADWPDLFGGSRGFIIEKAKFPHESVGTKPDLKAEMADGIPFSGGPWILRSWSKDAEVLVRNAHYWGTQPHLDQVTFVLRPDPAAEVRSLASGDVDAIFPSASTSQLADRFANDPNVAVAGGRGTSVEALWLKNGEPPTNEPQVRQAFAYAVDPGAIFRA